MKTLADFKRSCVVGSKWQAIFVEFSQDGVMIEKNLGIRPVESKNSVRIGFFREQVGRESYFYFPKADLVDFPDEKTMRYFEPDLKGTGKTLRLIYKLIED